MEHYELIRRKVVNEGKSQRQVARELGHSRKTIAKALKLRIPPGYRLTEPRQRPVIEPFAHIIDAWLEQNKKARRKQKLTAMRIYERLRDEYSVKRRAFSEDAVLSVLHNEPLSERGKLDLSDRPELINRGSGSRDAGIYDQLKNSKEVLV